MYLKNKERKMDRHVLLSALCTLGLLGCISVESNEPRDAAIESDAITMKLGSLRITNSIVELRCEIKNNSEQDIWVLTTAFDESRWKNTGRPRRVDGRNLLISKRLKGPPRFWTIAMVPVDVH